MGLTINHILSMTSPVDTNYENTPAAWNSVHTVAFDASIGTNTAITGGLMTGNTSGLSINVPVMTASSYVNMGGMASAQAMTLNGVSQSHVVAFDMEQPGSFSFLRLPVLMTTGSSQVTSNATLTSGAAFIYSTWNAVVYSQGVGASSQSWTSVASGSAGATIQNSYSFSTANSAWSITQVYTFPLRGANTSTVSTQYSQTAATGTFSTGYLTNHSSLRWFDIPFANSLSAGPYVLVFGYGTSTTTSGQAGTGLTGVGVSYSNHSGLSQNNIWLNEMGATGGSSGLWFGAGSLSTNSSGVTIPGFANSNVSSSASNVQPYFQLLRSA